MTLHRGVLGFAAGVVAVLLAPLAVQAQAFKPYQLGGATRSASPIAAPYAGTQSPPSAFQPYRSLGRGTTPGTFGVAPLRAAPRPSSVAAGRAGADPLFGDPFDAQLEYTPIQNANRSQTNYFNGLRQGQHKAAAPVRRNYSGMGGMGGLGGLGGLGMGGLGGMGLGGFGSR